MVDWNKVEKKPEKFHKVAGQLLIEMRAQDKDQKSKISNLESKINDLEGEKKRLNEKISDLESKIDGLKTDLSDTDKSLHKKLDEAKAEINEKEAAIATLLKEKETEVGIIQQELDKFKKDYTEIFAENKMLRDELAIRDYDFFKKTLKDRASRATSGDLGLKEDQ
ncbi:MAG: hypothetical protein ACFFCS_07255 [Candidatus Hodarchaeota archaeon]